MVALTKQWTQLIHATYKYKSLVFLGLVLGLRREEYLAIVDERQFLPRA